MTAHFEHEYLGTVLDQTVEFVHRYVVLGDHAADVVALWTAHSYVFECAPATPYLHPFSPEPGSGKTTLLDVLAVVARNAIQADNLTEAVLFRLIDAKKPTLLFDEVDAVFGKKQSDSAEGIRQVLNSGYRKGKQAYRCVPPSHEIATFDVFCPKATAGLHELPDTLAHRSIPIAMKPPLPSDRYQDFDPEEAEPDAEIIRVNLQSWADEEATFVVLTDPRLKPEKLPELDARGNEIWRILLRIADHAGGDWPARARDAAVELSGGDRVRRDGSVAVQLLSHIRDVFVEERVTCRDLAERLNGDDAMPYGGWNSGAGITTRELGRKLSKFGVIAKTIRSHETRANGYERDQFQDAWSRYIPSIDPRNRDTVTTRIVEPNPAEQKPGQQLSVTVSENGANPHEQSDVTLVTVSETEVATMTAAERRCPVCGSTRIGLISGNCHVCGSHVQNDHHHDPDHDPRWEIDDREVRRLLETYRPELIGRNDITTPGERREIAMMLLAEERGETVEMAA